MRIKRHTSSLGLILLVGIAIGYFLKSPAQVPQILKASPTPSPKATIAPTSTVPDVHRVVEVIDGDTIKIDSGQKVRYIGIDTPEIHATKNKSTCFGQEAKKKNEELVGGKMVKLTKDVSEVDRYGRLLRFVYLYDQTASTEAQFVNDYLVREGYAHAVTFPPDVSKADEFRTAETEARQANKGLWNSCK